MQTMKSACEPCRSRKRRCDRGIPACGRCARQIIPCFYALGNLSGIPHQRTRSAGFRHGGEQYGLWLATSEQARPGPAMPSPGLQQLCPIEFRWYMPRLLRHYHESLETFRVESSAQSTAFKLQSVWVQHALNDPCLFHVTLYIGSSYFDIKTGETPSPITLFHQTEVLRQVNERLSDPVLARDDGTIASVALLALFANLTGNQPASEIHTAGLRDLVRLKGGRSKLGLDGLLATLIRMNEMIQSVVFGLKSDLLPQGYHVVPPFGLEARILEFRALRYRILEAHESYSFTRGDSMMNLFREIYDFKLQISRLGNSIVTFRQNGSHWHRLDGSTILLNDDPVFSCCALAASIFWLLMEANADSDAQSEACLTKLVTLIQQLKAALYLVEDAAWLKSNPMAYCWVCTVGAALAPDTNSRIWFWVRQAAVMRILNAVDNFGLLDDIWLHITWLRNLHLASRRPVVLDVTKE